MLLFLLESCQANTKWHKKSYQKIFLRARAIQSSKFDEKINNLVSGEFFTYFQISFLDTLFALYSINFSYDAYQGL